MTSFAVGLEVPRNLKYIYYLICWHVFRAGNGLVMCVVLQANLSVSLWMIFIDEYCSSQGSLRAPVKEDPQCKNG